MGADAILETLRQLDSLRAASQPNEGASYAPKITKSEARIDWNRTHMELDRQVRAFNPVPGAESSLQGQNLKIWGARPVEGAGVAGTLLYFRNSKLVVACGKGALELLEIQRPGGRKMGAADFLRGASLDEGVRLGENPLASH